MKKLNKALNIRLFANIITCIVTFIILPKLDNIDNNILFFLSMAALEILAVASITIIDILTFKSVKKECKLTIRYCDDWPTWARMELEARENGNT